MSGTGKQTWQATGNPGSCIGAAETYIELEYDCNEFAATFPPERNETFSPDYRAEPSDRSGAHPLPGPVAIPLLPTTSCALGAALFP